MTKQCNSNYEKGASKLQEEETENVGAKRLGISLRKKFQDTTGSMY